MIFPREYENSGRTPLFSMLNFVCLFWILIANGGGRVTQSGVMNLQGGFCSKLLLCRSNLGSDYLFLYGAEALL